MNEDSILDPFIGLAAMVLAAVIAWFIGALLEKYIVTPMLRRWERRDAKK